MQESLLMVYLIFHKGGTPCIYGGCEIRYVGGEGGAKKGGEVYKKIVYKR